jgi:hypothetical protein
LAAEILGRERSDEQERALPRLAEEMGDLGGAERSTDGQVHGRRWQMKGGTVN